MPGNPAPGELATGKPFSDTIPPQTGPGLVQDLLNDIPGVSGIDRVGADLEAGYLAVTDVTLWRSVGWIVLGIILVVAGLLLWLRGPVNTLSNQLLQELP